MIRFAAVGDAVHLPNAKGKIVEIRDYRGVRMLCVESDDPANPFAVVFRGMLDWDAPNERWVVVGDVKKENLFEGAVQ